ncbi:hypothetical protein J1614_007329 [Plenodomus biglobosus]|nr:hypothetical protein J1614_007329 [Plenodomus biglobosus]
MFLPPPPGAAGRASGTEAPGAVPFLAPHLPHLCLDPPDDKHTHSTLDSTPLQPPYNAFPTQRTHPNKSHRHTTDTHHRTIPHPPAHPTSSRMSIENLKTFDPFAEADEDTGQVKQSQQDYIHIRIQQRNGRKTLTTVQGLPKKFDQKKILKVIKKKFACNGTIVSDLEMGEVVQLQGDQRKDVQDFLTDKKEGLGLDAKTIKTIVMTSGMRAYNTLLLSDR